MNRTTNKDIIIRRPRQGHQAVKMYPHIDQYSSKKLCKNLVEHVSENRHKNYAKTIREQGYDVVTSHNKGDALEIINKRLPDLAILDIGLGAEMEACVDLCREIRALSHAIPIIFLTARDSDVDAVSGLRLGADDYLSKDTSIHNLLARIAVLFRRLEALESTSDTDQIKRGKLTVDTARFRIKWGDDIIDLSLTEFWIVHSLAKRVDLSLIHI